MAGSVLATYPSSSSNAVYEIRLGNDGVTYCTCMGWRMNKHCKHLDHYASRSATALPTKKPVKRVSKGNVGGQEAVKISDVTAEVIRMLKGGK